MFKPLIVSFTLIVALSACSKKEDAASNNVPTPPANAASSSEEAAGKVADAPAQGLSRPEAGSERTPRDAAASTEAQLKKHKKQTANAAHSAKGTRSLIRRRWDEFQATVDRCDTATGAAREQCLAEAKETYQSGNFKCDALPPQERSNCLQFAERWNNAAADAPTAAVKRDKEPMMTAPDPGDPRPAERNRDSTKQHQDAVGTIPEPSKPN